jgi:hypothetical protein
MHTDRSSQFALGRTAAMARLRVASNPALMGDDPRLPRVGELVALHRWRGPRLWVGRVGSAYDKAVSVAFEALGARPAEPDMPEPGERVELAGLAGIPVDARGIVRGHKDAVVLLRDVTVGDQHRGRRRAGGGARGRLWCEDRAGSGCGVEVIDRFPDGLCISAPTWARPGDRVAVAGPVSTVGPVPALVVGCREGPNGRAVAHVAFLIDHTDPRLQNLLEGLPDLP